MAERKKIHQFFSVTECRHGMRSGLNYDGNSNGKMGVMATGGGDRTVTATKGIEFFSPFRHRCRHSVNGPLRTLEGRG